MAKVSTQLGGEKGAELSDPETDFRTKSAEI